MSRSYKHVPCCKDHTRGMKKCANRYIRRNYLVVPSGMAYKKLFCSWNICDYKFIRSFSFSRKRNIIIGNIQIKNYIGCGTNTTK